MTEFVKAAVSPQNTGQVAMAFGCHLIRIRAAETGGTMGAFEAVVPAGEGPPLHLHEREEEFFRVMSGRFGFWCGDDYIELEEGGLAVLPRGVPHRFQNIGQTEGRLLVVVTPGGFEGFFPAVENTRPGSMDEVGLLAARFGLRFVDARPAEQAA